jgi:outer membrane protein OmpA-like peptidoglycan-associated protein
MKKIIAIVALSSVITGCAPRSGIDKTAISSGVGAGIGAGAGAIVGNQVANLGPGAAIGAGAGLLSGFSTGLMYDTMESRMITQEKDLKAIQNQNDSNTAKLARLQDKLDRALLSDSFSGMYQVYFDTDIGELRAGSAANLETIANSIKMSPAAHMINVVGHADDSGNPEYNERLAEARARNVAAILSARGISTDQINVASYGAKRPIASNTTEMGRQLNRRVDIFISQ